MNLVEYASGQTPINGRLSTLAHALSISSSVLSLWLTFTRADFIANDTGWCGTGRGMAMKHLVFYSPPLFAVMGLAILLAYKAHARLMICRMALTTSMAAWATAIIMLIFFK